MNFFVYYLHSQFLQKYYIGQTDNLNRRIQEHNRGKVQYTKRGIPWKIIGFVPCATHKEAVALEKKLKKAKNIRYVQWYIQQNGTWNNERVGSSTG